MAGITSYSQLLKQLAKIRTDVLGKEVADKATALMQKNIDEVVYKAYTPINDNSRTGALRESVETGMQSADTLTVYNSRMDTGFRGETRDVVNVVETGKGYNWGNNLDRIIGERPFMEKTHNDLENGEFREALKSALQKRGLKVE